MDAIDAHPAISVEAWFDARCPWCYIGKVRLDRAIAKYQSKYPGAEVSIRHRSFLLAPDMPPRYAGGEAEYLREFEGVPLAQAQRSLPAIEAVAAAENIELRFDGVKVVNTWPIHRLFQFAQAQGLGEALLARVFQAYFVEHRDLASHTVLGELAERAGLEVSAAVAAVSRARWDDVIVRQWRRAQMLGVMGVPYFLFNAAYEIRGAIETTAFEQGLERIRQLEVAR